ncbi:MAG: sugar phosphate isomerase/epimerase [Chloroflexota bacterium]|nr:sugar phosphate isomerase/epimerase [Chloroflexota bacterium]
MPGGTLPQKYESARRFGFDAVELSERPAFDEARMAIRGRIPVTAIAGGYRGWLIDPDPELVATARADLAALIDLAGELGTGIVVVPIWGRTKNLPGIATGRTRDDDEALFLDGLGPLAAQAERVGARIFLEPLNRYQNDVCVTIGDAIRLRDRVGSPAVSVVGDTFHMNIEEADMGRSLVQAGERLGYVQVADSQRFEPGAGHIDFAPIFSALGTIGYDGDIGVECASLSGEPEVVLPRAAALLRSLIAEGG